MNTRDSKRILSVTVTREVDTDPDTSYYGEYSNEKTSEYSIDRAHAEDCSSVTSGELIEKLERVITYLQLPEVRTNGFMENDDAVELVITAQDELQECDCNESGDMERGQYRYFNPSLNYVDKQGRLTDGNTPEEVRKYVRQDYERMESLNRGVWCFTGTYASAEVQLNGMSTIQTIRSGGLWGTESDSDSEHFAEIEKDELEALRSELHAIGFSKRAITAAFRKVEHRDE